ncbi:MAG: hypothetical protein CMJ29_01670 [Phycisphaerae bacterium]|nr:hypothetical protein [Phycisphaerae bacterium]MAT80337.1 hypothetical protein [Phycisphaerae bacterium]
MDDVMVLDVETTGLSRRNDVVTTACWYYQGTWHRWVRGLDTESTFRSHWTSSSELVTFNGRNFDEKFVIKDLGVELHANHRDIMYDGWKQGHRGGLKKVAETCGLPRPPEISGMDGRSAILLWKLWESGNPDALQLLSLYNAWDVWLTLGLYRRFVHDLPLEDDHRIPWTLDMGKAADLLIQSGIGTGSSMDGGVQLWSQGGS